MNNHGIDVSQTKTDVFLAIVMKCSHWNLLILICYSQRSVITFYF